MLETIRQDIGRSANDGIFSEEEIQKYLNGQAESLFITLNTLLLPGKKEKYINKFSVLGTLVYLIWLRDIVKDFEMGYINISREDIAKYNLNTKKLVDDPNFTGWFSDKTNSFIKLQGKQAEELSRLPFKLKIFWFCQFPYNFYRINKIKNYNYDPSKIREKDFLQSLKIFIQILPVTIRYLIKVFFLI